MTIVYWAYYSFAILSCSLVFASNKKNKIINFDLVKGFQNKMKDKDQKEFDAAFKMYIQTAGFDDILDSYQEKIHGVIEKRLQDALILKKDEKLL